MISLQCRRILKGFRKMTAGTDSTFCFSESFTDGENDFYCFDTEKTYDYTRDKKEINAILDYLVDEKHLAVENDSINYYRLTYLGLHPWHQFKQFLYTSILLPAVVSFITSAITTVVALLIAHIIS